MTSERIAVVGCGLIGTSIAMAAGSAGTNVRGFDLNAKTLALSAERSGLQPTGSLAECVADAALVFVCIPIAAIPAAVAEALDATPGAVVTDAGSVKSEVVEGVEVKAAVDALGRFVGSHPMGGSERSGPGAASASLLDGAVWVLTPTARTEPGTVSRVEAFAEQVGATPLTMEPLRHDRAVAIVSHLPQVVSTALMGLAAREEQGEPETLLLAAGGFRDLTRLAASNPELWADILRSNRDELGRAIDLYIEDLARLREDIRAGEASELERALREATKARLELTAKPQVRAGVAILQIPVPDRPGVLADLTAALGERSVNIEDLQIVHSPEGGRGSVHITVAASQADDATRAIGEHGFEAARLA
ncbi:MAG: prephenate dehydrogenase/arogenate dehydrogenase family protein [Actinomycetota bacterium]